MVAKTRASCLAASIPKRYHVALITIKIVLFRRKRKPKWNKYIFYQCLQIL